MRSDGKLYNSVFIALNEVGQVVSWQFTRTTSLDKVKPQMENLCAHMKQSCSVPFTIVVDACCSQRPKLQHIFGADAVVSLDIFHAVKRVTRNATHCLWKTALSRAMVPYIGSKQIILMNKLH